MRNEFWRSTFLTPKFLFGTEIWIVVPLIPYFFAINLITTILYFLWVCFFAWCAYKKIPSIRYIKMMKAKLIGRKRPGYKKIKESRRADFGRIKE